MDNDTLITELTALRQKAESIYDCLTQIIASLADDPAPPVPSPDKLFEAQAWWGENTHIHIRMGKAYPYGDPVSGTIPLPLHLTVFNGDGRHLFFDQLRVFFNPDESPSEKDRSHIEIVSKKDAIEITERLWSQDFMVNLNTSIFSFDGWKKLRIRGRVKERGKFTLYVAMTIPILISSGVMVVNHIENTDFVRVDGWATNPDIVGYIREQFDNPFDSETLSFASLHQGGPFSVSPDNNELFLNPRFHAIPPDTGADLLSFPGIGERTYLLADLPPVEDQIRIALRGTKHNMGVDKELLAGMVVLFRGPNV